MDSYEVLVLKEGYCRDVSSSTFVADCTITLLKGPLNILVDTGNASDKDLLIQALAGHGLSVGDVNFVVCTHGHIDHIGNLNLFPNAVVIVGKSICTGGDKYVVHDFEQDRSYEIDEQVRVTYLPGHTSDDVTVFVKTPNLGVVAITGDIFECKEDIEDPSLWMELSEHKERQEESRLKILKMADVIVPGHGPMFCLKPDIKRHISVEKFEEFSEEEKRKNASEHDMQL